MTITETFAKPSLEEMGGRLARLQEAMAENGLQHYVLTDPSNVLWLTNFANYVHERPFILVVPASGTPKFVVPRLELDHVESRAIGAVEFVTYREFPAPDGETWADRLASVLGTGGGKTGVEPTAPLMVAEMAGERAEKTGLIDELRAIKSSYEISRIAYACRLISEAHAQLLEGAHPGWSQSEINASVAKTLFGKLVGDDPNINPFATSIHTLIQNPFASHDPHNFSDLDMKMVEGGPHLSIFNSVFNGYGAEIERCFFLGHVPEVARKPFDVMMEAREKVFEMTHPGVIMNDIDRAANEIFKSSGYGDACRHRAGHGMGVTSHEGPFLAEGDMREIRPGMVFTIEPGIYIKGLGGFRHSDTVLTTEDGLVTLTYGPVQLSQLVLS